MISIRVATAADAALIADMSRQTFYDSFAAVNTQANLDKFFNEQFTREMLIAEVGAPRNIFLLAYERGTPVGYVRMRENNNPPGLGTDHAIEIARIYAIKSHIGKGVGSLLMQHCVDTAVRKNYRTLWLGVWERNHRAIDFYKRWGFKKFSTHDFILGDDIQNDWLMKKEL